MVRAKGHQFVTILGVNVCSNPRGWVLTSIESLMEATQKVLVFTPNPEIILAAKTNTKLRNALNSAHFAVPDGVGLRLASVVTGKGTIPVIRGRELMLDLLNLASRKGLKVFFLGTTGQVIKESISKTRHEYPAIEVDGDSGPYLDIEALPSSASDVLLEKKVIKKIANFRPDILFVGFGAPKQELWLTKHQHKLPFKIALTVGGAFNYYVGHKPLPPSWVAYIGFEWLWRLLHEKGHFKRVFNALFVFPVSVLAYQFRR